MPSRTAGPPYPHVRLSAGSRLSEGAPDPASSRMAPAAEAFTHGVVTATPCRVASVTSECGE